MGKGTCPVVYANGDACGRLIWSSGLCSPCYRWRRSHGGSDPNGRKGRRSPGEAQGAIRAAAASVSNDCVYFGGHKRRASVQLDGVTMAASRAVWLIAYGDTGGQSVLHTCHQGQQGCINPRHMYLGDQRQNVVDMVDATRQQWGERNARHKLTEADVREIRKRVSSGEPCSEVARDYPVVLQTVVNVATGRSWSLLDAQQYRRRTDMEGGQ